MISQRGRRIYLKGISSMRLHRELGTGQKAAWSMVHRLRKMFDAHTSLFPGPLEVDETCLGGIDANTHANKKTHHGNRSGVQQPVVGLQSGESTKVKAQGVQPVTAIT